MTITTQQGTAKPLKVALQRILAFAPTTASTTGKPIPRGGVINPQAFQNLPPSKSKDVSLTKNPPVVLLRGMLPVLLEAETLPAGQTVLWDVVPDPANPAPQGKPALNPIAGLKNNKATLAGDVAGAFSVLARIDPSDKPVVWNVVFVDVTLGQSNATGNPGTGYISQATPVSFSVVAVDVATGDHAASKFGWSASATVQLQGAGPKGDIGVDDIELHMLQNGTGDTVMGLYVNADKTRMFKIREVISTTPAVDTEDLPGTVTPDKHFPGSTAFKCIPLTGTIRTAQFSDTPNTVLFPAIHPNHKDATLRFVGGSMEFRVAIAAVSKRAPHTVVIYGKLAWSADVSGFVTIGVLPALGGVQGPIWTPEGNAGTTTDKVFAPVPGGADAAGQGFEVWPPNLMNQISKVVDP